MISGAHAIVFSTRPDADIAFMRDVLQLSHVDAGGGFLIFGLPPAEVAIHGGDKNDVHELYLICDDVAALVERLSAHGIACSAVNDRGWGMVTAVTLPGGGTINVYEPRHARPKAAGSAAKRAAKKTAKRPGRKKTAKKAAKKKAARR